MCRAAVCARYVRDDDTVKDLLQDTFIKIYTRFDSFEYRGAGSLQAWCRRIAVNEALQYLRTNKRLAETPLDAVGELPQPDETPDIETIPQRELLAMIRRLPVTFPVDYYDIPSSANFPYDYTGRASMTAGKDKYGAVRNVGFTEYAEGLDVGYRFFDKPDSPDVSYPFGYGLSYTVFEISKPVFQDGTVTVTVKNTGGVPGREVVMVKDPVLRAFGKTELLQPGASETLVLPVF